MHHPRQLAMAALALFAILGKATDSLVVLLTRRLVRWQDSFVPQG